MTIQVKQRGSGYGMLDLAAIIEQTSRRCRTASSFVSDALRSAILTGVLKDGEALRQDELATMLGVSRMPIREALRRLEAEGFIDFQPHKGAVVAEMSAEEADEIYAIRAMVECRRLRESIPHLTDDALDRAAAVLAEMDTEQEPLRWSEIHQHFHDLLYSGVARRRLSAVITSLNCATSRYVRLLLTQFDYGDRSQGEHREILAACRRRDIEGATALLLTHISAGRDAVVNFLQNRNS